jgi:7,8-dihydropterin-6-yl-methyl-4-(beta-D-ribofuranosyl)aminobenzene 5'-phosphate synthase
VSVRVTCLIENESVREDCRAEHGLSLYIETAGRRILMDAGQSDLFLQNAAVLGIDLSNFKRDFLTVFGVKSATRTIE